MCGKKSETIILMRNLFRINLGRNMAYIYSYSSLRYSRVTQENISGSHTTYEIPSDPRRHDGTMLRDQREPRWHETHRIEHTHNIIGC